MEAINQMITLLLPSLMYFCTFFANNRLYNFANIFRPPPSHIGGEIEQINPQISEKELKRRVFVASFGWKGGGRWVLTFSVHTKLLYSVYNERGDTGRAQVGDVRDPLLRTENLSPSFTSDQGIVLKLKWKPLQSQQRVIGARSAHKNKDLAP